MLINKLNTPVLPPAGPKNANTNDFTTLSNSRKLLKPVKLSNDENINKNGVSMSPRKRILLQLKTKNNPVTYSKPSLGSRLNKRLSLRKNQDGGKNHISDKLFKKTTKKDDRVVVVDSNKRNRLGIINDVKLVLFQYKRAKITCFENTLQQAKNSNNNNNSNDSNNFEFLNFNSSDRILGHGPIEIYSIHDRELNYLQCGTVIYPILPKMKILRIGLNQFILPLSNPERYWLISLNTVNDSKLQELVDCLKKICSFRNLYVRLNLENGGDNTDDDDDGDGGVHNPIANDIVDKNDSISSISSDLACLNLSKLDSRQSSLDLELDKFEETINSFNIPLSSSRQPKSCSSSILTDFPMSHNVKHKYSNNTNITDASIHHKPSFDTLLSRNSLYQVEPSWMNIDEGDSMLNKSYDQKTLTDTILFQNLTRFKLESEGLAKLSQVEIRNLVLKKLNNANDYNYGNDEKNEFENYKILNDEEIPSKSMVQRLFGW